MKSFCGAAALWALVALTASHAQAATPQVISLTPVSGSGQTQTFTLAVSDADGAADISGMNVLINRSFDGQHGCWMFYDHVHKQLSVAGDNGWGDAANSQCSVQLLSAGDSGNQATLSVNITFNSNWPGNVNVYGRVGDLENNDSGYLQMGTYTVVTNGATPDFTVSITPASQTTHPGQTVDYNIVVTSLNGFSGIVTYNTLANPQFTGLTIREINPGPTLSVPQGGSATATLQVQTSTSTPPANNIALTSTFTSGSIQHNYQTTLSLLSPTAPAISLTPNSGGASTQTFTITVEDPAGYRAIQSVSFLINSRFSGDHACWLYYQNNALSLASDNGSDWSNGTPIDSNPNSAHTIQNSQCSLFGGPTTVSGSGNLLTLTITLTFSPSFSPSFSGYKQVFARASDVAGPDSGYLALGTFAPVAGSSTPDFTLTVSPGSQNVTGAGALQYVVAIAGYNGYSGTPDLSVTGLPQNSTLSPPANVAAGNSTTFTVHTAASTPAGSYVLNVAATDGALSHAATATLNVQTVSTPALNASPASGSGASQTFTFTASGQDAGSAPNILNVLFNTAVDGRSGCWISANDQGLALASDDAAMWMSPAGNGVMQNSQCIVSNIQGVASGSFGFTATITFKAAFKGNRNIFMYASNRQGGETGYQLRGAWTVTP